ncbi:MAG TPA: MarR family transcriptional regulator [Gemmatimonadales bacterium]|nr:MarR family transcriptional regulator [Gemmatimonadales bacterium]
MAQPPADARAAAVANRLHSAAIHLLRRVRAQDDAMGLTAPLASALSVIVFRGPISLGALAAAEQVRPPSITRIVTELERLGLVVRSAAPEDRRVQRVRATPKGRHVLEAGRARRVASLAAALAALTPAELATLDRAATLLERLLLPRPGAPAG